MLPEFRKQLELCWSKSTSFSPKGKDGSSIGQCYVTALLVKDVIGGEVMAGWIKWEGKRLHHFWNRIVIGGEIKEVDFTSDQFGGDGFTPLIEGKVHTNLNFHNSRFRRLRKNFIALYQ